MVGCDDGFDYLDEFYFYKTEIQNAKTLEELEKLESDTGFIAEESSLTDLINERKKELGYKRYGIIWRELKEPKTVKRAEAAAKRKREEAKKRAAEEEAKRKAEDDAKKRREEAEAKKRTAEEEATRKAEDDAKRKAEEERKEKEGEKKERDDLDKTNDLLKGLDDDGNRKKADELDKINRNPVPSNFDIPSSPNPGPNPGGSNIDPGYSPDPGYSSYP